MSALVSPDLLSILAQDKNAGVAAVAKKAASYQRDVEKLRVMATDFPRDAQTWEELADSYAIVARELKGVAQELKSDATP